MEHKIHRLINHSMLINYSYPMKPLVSYIIYRNLYKHIIKYHSSDYLIIRIDTEKVISNFCTLKHTLKRDVIKIKKEVGVTLRSNETSNQPVRNAYQPLPTHVAMQLLNSNTCSHATACSYTCR